PASYCAFLEQGNGASLAFYVCPSRSPDGTSPRVGPARFHSTRLYGGWGTLLFELEQARTNVFQLPPRILPIAEGWSAPVFLDLTPEGAGRVVVFRRGLPGWTGLPTDSAWLDVAPSFEAYLNALELDREELAHEVANSPTTSAHVAAWETHLDLLAPDWRDDERLRGALEAARGRVGG
ncbi:MAG TPA: hypothetical protein RMG45_14270, partial [Polyangiaceae bacterium LLY-WYZ-15_(1-7)]|nr:hypothetical protein [Polyangiaceae bacterium LLY-WYZ-15_(1-7)]